MESIQYRPLKRGQIRLLKFTSSELKNPHFTLVHVSVWWRPRYAALSYTWGSDFAEQPLRVGGTSCRITQNLHDALRKLNEQGRLKTNRLWVDAICINQADKTEKSVQIGLMRTIYERAQWVFVWLGEPAEPENNHLAFRKINWFYARFGADVRRTSSYAEARNSSLASMSVTDPDIIDAPGSETYRAWVGIRSLLSCTWWERTWVYQEATVPEMGVKVLFLHGNQVTTWHKISYILDVVGRLESLPGGDMDFISRDLENARKIHQVRNIRLQHPNQDLLEIMQLFRISNCNEVYDKIYAPLCLASGPVKRGIVLDYTRSVYDLHVDIVKVYLAQPQRELDFLGYTMNHVAKSSGVANSSSGSTWPSWLPDWREKSGGSALKKDLYEEETIIPAMFGMEWAMSRLIMQYHRKNLRDRKLYNATGNSCASARISGGTLTLAAIYCDTIAETLPRSRVGIEPHGISQGESDACSRWSRGQSYTTGESFSLAIARTKCADALLDEFGRARGRLADNTKSLNQTLFLGSQMMKSTDAVTFYLQRSVESMSTLRVLCHTETGYVGLVPRSAVSGDCIYAFLGGQVLYVVRKHRGDRNARQFEFIGECYIHGMMDGEVMRQVHDGSTKIEDIILI